MKMDMARTACRWAWLVAGLALSLAVSGHAATGTSITFSNKVATFRDAQGTVYQDANIYSAEFKADGTGRIIYRTNGEYNAISFARLSPETLTRLGVPDGYADIARDRDEQRKEAAARESQAMAEEQQRLLDPTNLVSVRVDAVLARVGSDPFYGAINSCRVQSGRNPALLNILVARLPDRVASYYESLARQEQEVNALKNQVAYGQSWIANASWQLSQEREQLNQTAAQVRTATAGMADWVYPTAVQREAVESARRQEQRNAGSLTNAQKQLTGDQERLQDLEKKLLALQDSGPATTTLLMLPSRRTFNGIKLFLCAPESVQPQLNVSAKPAAVPTNPN
jgi:hypothetical protein